MFVESFLNLLYKLSMRKRIFVFLSILSIHFFTFSQNFGNQELVPAGHWVYDALTMLNNEQMRTSFAVNAPLPVGELKMYFDLIDYEKLSEGSKITYDRLLSYFEKKAFRFELGGAFASVNLGLNPEFYYKSNKDIDWTFGTDYTGKLKNLGFNVSETNFKDRVKQETGSQEAADNSRITTVEKDYGAASAWNVPLRKYFFDIPLYIGWSDYFIIHSKPGFAKNFWGMTDDSNFINLSYSNDTVEFLQPDSAYGSAGMTFGNWGFNVNLNRSGLQFGKTQTGSVIYNSTFQTNFAGQLNLYSPRLKYNLDVVEIASNRLLYLHLIEARPLVNWLRLSFVEGTFINEPFEFRFLNPLMFMHSFGAWDDYKTADEAKWYDGEAHVCAYMGIQVEATPCRNLRLYFLYAQNEIQSEAEKSSIGGKCMPDSLGIQLGAEFTKSDRNGGWWLGTLEGIYTTPYLYIKQGSEWSLYSYRYDMQKNGKYPLCSWIGTPFGPDALGFQTRLRYEQFGKWNTEFNFLFLAHGTNSFGLFNSKVVIDGVEYSAYYPSVLRKMGLISDDDAVDMARTYKLTGTVQFTNQITLKGNYILNDHLNFNAQLVYSFIFNNKNKTGDFAHGMELSLGMEYKLFN